MVHKDQRFHWVAVTVRMACILWYKCLFAYKCIVFHDEPVTGTKNYSVRVGVSRARCKVRKKLFATKYLLFNNHPRKTKSLI